MRVSRPIAGVAVAAILGGLGVAAATSASAQDWGSQISGNVYFLKDTPAGLAAAVPADQVTSGTYAGQPFKEVATDVAAPTGTKLTQVYARLKTAADSSLWQEVALDDGELFDSTRVDASGDAFNANPDGFGNFKLSAIQQWAATSSDRLLPVTLVFFDALQHPLGHVDTVVKIDLNSTNAGTWTQQNPVLIQAVKSATTTTLAATPATVEQGSPVSLLATVAPAAATGTVEYFDGTTSLGSAAIGTPLSVSTLSVATHSITAVYSGDASYKTSTSAAQTVTVTAVAPRSTTTVLTVDKTTGAPYQSVTLTATVGSSLGTPAGSVTFTDGTTTLGTATVTGGIATLNPNSLGAGDHSFVATFTGTAPYQNSTSAAVTATYVAVGGTDTQNVDVVIPAGAITITTPYTAASPLHLGTAVLDSASSTYSASAKFGDATDPAKAIKITDTRAGSTGWDATVMSTAFSNGTSTFSAGFVGLINLEALQVSGNALQASDVAIGNHAPVTDPIDVAKKFASYHPAAPKLGTAQLDGTLSIAGVPSSVTPGTYTGQLIFTAN